MEIEEKPSKKIDPAGIILIILFLVLIIYVVIRKKGLSENASYTKGVIVNIDHGVRGNVNLNYYYFVDAVKYKGISTTEFCQDCNYTCCHSGDSVIVKYQKDSPKNSKLLHQLPKGASLTY